jgi:Tfp pilus assembly protein PilX
MTKRMRIHTDQEGWVVVTAMILMAIMLGTGLAIARFIDSGTKRSQKQRYNESSFTLAEGTLYAQGFALARNWPSATSAGYPYSCTSTASYVAGSTLAKQCPNKTTLTGSAASAFKSVDFTVNPSTTWITAVRDNGGSLTTAYDVTKADLAQGSCASPCTRDFNGDNTLWVQAYAKVKGKSRNVVALMRLETLSENVPQVAVTAGALAITNNGNNQKIDNTGSSVTLRCDVNNSNCADWREPVQIKPTAPVSGNPASLLNASQMQRFRETAIANGTYYAGCPPEISTASVIFVEDCQNPGNYNGSGFTPGCAPPSGLDGSCVNSIAKPGFLVVHCGALRMTGNWTYVGVVYFANGSDNDPAHPCTPRGTSPPTCSGNSLDGNSVLDTQGGFGVWGALAADGNACVKLGSNGFQVSYDRNVFNAVQSLGTVGLVQNTWRELPAS